MNLSNPDDFVDTFFKQSVSYQERVLHELITSARRWEYVLNGMFIARDIEDNYDFYNIEYQSGFTDEVISRMWTTIQSYANTRNRIMNKSVINRVIDTAIGASEQLDNHLRTK